MSFGIGVNVKTGYVGVPLGVHVDDGRNIRHFISESRRRNGRVKRKIERIYNSSRKHTEIARLGKPVHRVILGKKDNARRRIVFVQKGHYTAKILRIPCYRAEDDTQHLRIFKSFGKHGLVQLQHHLRRFLNTGHALTGDLAYHIRQNMQQIVAAYRNNNKLALRHIIFKCRHQLQKVVGGVAVHGAVDVSLTAFERQRLGKQISIAAAKVRRAARRVVFKPVARGYRVPQHKQT